MIKYEKITVEILNKTENLIKRINDDGTESFIPMDESNSDYQAYLTSLEILKK